MDIPSRMSGGNWYTNKDAQWSSYHSMKLHEEMIRDRFFKSFCQDVILKNKHLFQDKTVLDVNCGTGVLSLLIASQGAKTVIGIEPSNLAELARENVLINNIEEVVRIIPENVEEIKSLPDGIKSVDIIVSQWMGFLLFDQAQLNTLIQARDRWLKSDGLIFPDCIRLFLTATENNNRKNEIYTLLKYENFDMKSFKSMEFELPKMEIVPASKIVTNSALLRVINLKTINTENFCFSEHFELTAIRSSPVHAFVLYFEVGFTKCHKHIFISSSPYQTPSRWKQLVLFFENHLFVERNECINGTFSLKKSKTDSALFFNLNVRVSGASCKTAFFSNYIL